MQHRHPVTNINTRRFPRVPSQHTVRVRILGERRPESVMQTQVISAGGCMLVSERSIGFGSLMELAITLDGQVLRVDARAAWESRRGGREYEVGIEFLRISPKDRTVLDRLVRTRLSSTAA
jgi:c-di-GMP-binding flagellar brake protein YcgR